MLWEKVDNQYPPLPVFLFLIVRTYAGPFTYPDTISSSFLIFSPLSIRSPITVSLLEIIQGVHLSSVLSCATIHKWIPFPHLPERVGCLPCSRIHSLPLCYLSNFLTQADERSACVLILHTIVRLLKSKSGCGKIKSISCQALLPWLTIVFLFFSRICNRLKKGID